jgi:hypothetical protein
MNTDATRQRMLEKLARSEEAEPDRSLTRTLDQPTKLIGGTTNGSGEAEEGASSVNAAAWTRACSPSILGASLSHMRLRSRPILPFADTASAGCGRLISGWV